MKEIHVNTNIDFELKSPAVKKALIVFLIILLMFFTVYPIIVFNKTDSGIKTQTAVQKTVYSTIDTEAFVVRNEVEINNAYSGTIVPAVANGNKVAIGDSVANVYSGEIAAQNAEKLDELQNEIDYYTSIANAHEGTMQTDVVIYKSNISNALFAMSSCVEQNDLSDLYELSRELRSAITKKQIALGTKVDVSDILSELTNEYQSVKKASGQGTPITAQISGYYVNTSDGYENIVDFSTVEELTYKEVNSILKKEPNPVSYDNVGKLITDFNWYLVCNTKLEKLGNIKSGSNAVVSFVNSPVDDLKMTVEAINQAQTDEPVTIILRSNIMDEDIAALRKSSIKIRVESFTGLAIDRTALRTVDGVKGVYVKVGNIVEFKKINIVYSDDNFVLSQNPDNEKGYLKLYDEIILEGTDLYDSKLLS